MVLLLNELVELLEQELNVFDWPKRRRKHDVLVFAHCQVIILFQATVNAFYLLTRRLYET